MRMVGERRAKYALFGASMLGVPAILVETMAQSAARGDHPIMSIAKAGAVAAGSGIISGLLTHDGVTFLGGDQARRTPDEIVDTLFKVYDRFKRR